MPNRILKESICCSETIDKMGPFEETVFYRLIVNCDDYGRMDGRTAILKSRLFPLRQRVTNKDIESALHKLADIGCVDLYEVDGKPYLCLPAWEVHQTVRAKRSRYPSPDEGNMRSIASKNSTSENICKHMKADESICPRNPIQSESNPNLNTNTKRASSRELDSVFEELWNLYPSKKGKGQVSRAAKERLAGVGIEEMKRAIDRYVKELEKDDWRKPQNGSTFFNSGYVDYLDDNFVPGKASSRKQGSSGTFQQFPQRDYSKADYASLEQQILQRQIGAQ